MKLRTLFTLGSLLPAVAMASNVNVTFEAQDTVLTPGTSTFVDIVASYDGSDHLLGGALTFLFDANVFDIASVAVKARTDISGSNGTIVINGSSGKVQNIGFASFIGEGGKFTFATLELKSTGRGGSSTFDAVDADDPIFAWVSESMEPVSITSTPISVAVVPEPDSYALMLLGLGVVGEWVARRGRQRTAKQSGSSV